MSTGSISEASLKYFEDRRITALLDEAMRDVLMEMPEDPLLFLEKVFQRKTPLRLMMCGPPGCGKGTQCGRLAAKYGVRHICTGDLLKSVALDESDTAREMARHIREGSLVPDDLFVELVVKEVRQAEEAGAGWVLDGFPRSRAQAIYLQTAGISPQRFIFLDVPENVGAARAVGVPNSSDAENSAVADDSPATLKTRVEYFAARKEELIDCYRPFYVRVDGNKSTDEVFADICAQIDAIEIPR